MNKKFLLAVFLIGIVLATIIVEVKAINASTVTLTLGNNANNASTQYPADTYSLFTLNETMMYNDIVQTQVPNRWARRSTNPGSKRRHNGDQDTCKQVVHHNSQTQYPSP